jgi:hypothetical protein
MKKYLGWVFIALLAVVSAISYAYASATIKSPRVMSGLFCNEQSQLVAVLSHPSVGIPAIEEVNKDKQVCVLHAPPDYPSLVMVSEMRFIRSDTYRGDTLYMYEATVEGFFIGGLPHRIEPLKQFVYTMEPLDPSHKDRDA